MALANTTVGNTGNAVFSLGTGSLYEELHAHVYAFDFTITNDEYDASTFATSSAGKEYAMGMVTIEGHCRAFLDALTHIAAASFAAGREAATVKATLTLTAKTGRTFAFKANVENPAVGVNKNTGLNTLDFDFVNQGDIDAGVLLTIV